MKNVICFVFLILFSSLSFYCQQAGDLDSTFGVNGIVVTDFVGYDTRINMYDSDGIKAVFSLSDGKILCAGTADKGKHFIFSKYISNGDNDLGFGSEGILKIENLGILTCAGKNHQSKIIGAGYNDSEIVLTKIDVSGEIDEEFGEEGIAIIPWDISGYSVKIRAMDFQDDDKIILVGDLMSDTFAFEGGIILYRLFDNGVVDSSFGENGRAIYYVSLLPFEGDTDLMPFGYGEIYSVKILSENKILVGGHFLNKSTLVRFNSNGSVDESFGIDGCVKFNYHMSGSLATSSRFFSIAIDQLGRVISTGIAYSPIIATSKVILGCINNLGTMVDTFGEDGRMVFDEIDDYYNNPMSLVVQSDNKIISSGYRFYSVGTEYKFCFEIIRFHEDGTIDSTFGENGIVRTHISDSSLAFCSALQDDGKLLVAGVSDSGAFTIARYHTQSAPTSIQPNEKYSSDIVLYPNPVKDILQINVLEDKIVSIEISDVTGRKIYLPLKENTINVSSLPSGLYFIKIKTEKGMISEKFIKK